jgi:hypothetical protein
MPFKIRLAKSSDFNRLIDFYQNESSERLPAPSPRALGQALENYQLFLMEDDRRIAATAGIFDVSPPNSRNFIGELAGTRVTQVVGSTQPISIHSVFVVLRLLGFAAANFENVDDKSADSLIAIIRRGNARSASNLQGCGFLPLPRRPKWLQYDEISWNGKITANQWDYYYASPETVRRCAELFFTYRMHEQTLTLKSKAGRIRIGLDLPGLYLHLEELRMLAVGPHRIRIGVPPNELILEGRSPPQIQGEQRLVPTRRVLNRLRTWRRKRRKK